MIAADEILTAVPGPSDRDYEAWLAERHTGVTATEIRDMYLEQIGLPSHQKRKVLIGRKLGRIPEVGDLSYVPVIGWGRQREAVIEQIVLQRYGIEPESRVFRMADEPRKLASPDGIGRDFDGAVVVSEIKTAGEDIAPGTPAFARKGYLFQMVWQMRVMGARRCLYVWERRVEVAPNVFEPGELQFAWIEYDEALAAALDALADEFLAELATAASEPWEQPEVDEILDTHAVNYLRALDLERQAKELKAPAWSAMLAAERSQTSALARITFTPGGESTETVADVEAAKSADPDLFAEVQALSKRWNEHAAKFTKTVPVVKKPNLRVTAVKQKDE